MGSARQYTQEDYHKDLQERLQAEAREYERIRTALIRRDFDALPPAVSLGYLRDAQDLLTPPEQVSPWLGVRGTVTMLAGREKLGKSTFCSNDAIGAAKDGYKVLWLSFEESAVLILRRFMDLGESALENLYMPLSWVDTPKRLDRAFEYVNPDIVYFDTLSTALGTIWKNVPDPSHGEQWARLMQEFQKRAEKYGAAIIIVHHGTKEDGRYRGSTGIAGGVDTVINFLKAGGYKRELETISRWNIPSRLVEYNPEKGIYEESKALAFGGDVDIRIRDEILYYIDHNPGCSTRDVISNVQGQDKDVLSLLKGLEHSGSIVNNGRTTKHSWFLS